MHLACQGTLTLQAMPNWLTTVLLAMLLTVLTWKLSVRGFITWRKETAVSKKERDSEAAEPLLQHDAGDHSSHQHEPLHDAFRSNGEHSAQDQAATAFGAYVCSAARISAMVLPGLQVQACIQCCLRSCTRPNISQEQLINMLPGCLQDMGTRQAPRSQLSASRVGGD